MITCSQVAPEVYRFLNDLSREHELYLIAGTKIVLYSSDPAVNPHCGPLWVRTYVAC
jgi:hypothetical protein